MDLETSPPSLPVVLEQDSPLPSPIPSPATQRSTASSPTPPPQPSSSTPPSPDLSTRSRLALRLQTLALFPIFFDDGCATSWRALFSPEQSAQRRGLLASLPHLQLQFFALARHLHRQISLKLGSPSARRTKTIHIVMDMIRILRDLDFPVKFAVQKVLRMVVKTITHTSFLMVYQRFSNKSTQNSPITREFRHLYALASAGRSPPPAPSVHELRPVSPSFSGITSPNPDVTTPHEESQVAIDFGSIPMDLSVAHSSEYSSPSPPPRRSRPSVHPIPDRSPLPNCAVTLPKLKKAIQRARGRASHRPTPAPTASPQAPGSPSATPGPSRCPSPSPSSGARRRESPSLQNERLLQQLEEEQRRRSNSSSRSITKPPKKRDNY